MALTTISWVVSCRTLCKLSTAESCCAFSLAFLLWFLRRVLLFLLFFLRFTLAFLIDFFFLASTLRLKLFALAVAAVVCTSSFSSLSLLSWEIDEVIAGEG